MTGQPGVVPVVSSAGVGVGGDGDRINGCTSTG